MPVRSEVKQRVLLSLLSGEKKLAELKSDLRIRETTILHVLKDFETLGVTSKVSGIYGLTSLGIVEALVCEDLLSTARVLEKFKDFWLSHNIESVPRSLLTRIGLLEDSTLVKTETNELGKVHETFLQMLLDSKVIRGTSPIFHPDYVKAFEVLLNQGDSVELILTAPVLAKTLETAAGEVDLLRKYIVDEKLKIYLHENLWVALTVSDKSLSLGLFSHDGNYDYGMDLVSMSDKAIEWGNELFQSYLSESRRLGVENL
jgi:predicted transcriptional regulator